MTSACSGFSVTPASIDFGIIPYNGASSPDLYISITAGASASLDITYSYSINPTGHGEMVFDTGVLPNPFTLAAGANYQMGTYFGCSGYNEPYVGIISLQAVCQGNSFTLASIPFSASCVATLPPTTTPAPAPPTTVPPTTVPATTVPPPSTGNAACTISSSPNTLVFSNPIVGSCSAPQTVTLTAGHYSPGFGPFTFYLASGYFNSYVISGSTCTSELYPDQTCSFQVQFCPATGTSPQNAVLVGSAICPYNGVPPQEWTSINLYGST